ncbi:MAG: ribonuclease PH [Nitrospiraceae bacterium]|uniref:Ribonuclease PH n=1 Tax=Leptospirillum ferrodiazotrophum TaxID=412449 RepID=C6HUV5_9BACT|nr:MAG: ribonuclease PH [Leptospirillum ferrodiazotrophum]MDA8112027.1 ribonuclease PH [Nitrospiraceae bacterium]
MRSDGRTSDQLRTLSIDPSPNRYAEGSALIRMGFTHVLATVSLEEKVPPFLKDQGRGWVTAEYGMLPRSTHERSPREAARGKQSGRTQEIQRLIGRSLRSVVNFEKMGVRTATIDCDVIQADGGTRCASIGGAFVALALAFSNLKKVGVIAESPLVDYLAAVSVGIVDGEPCLDLCYTEDSAADVDMNVVMTGKGELVEVQGTAEHRSFSRKEMDRLLDLAWKGISEIVDLQKRLVQI